MNRELAKRLLSNVSDAHIDMDRAAGDCKRSRSDLANRVREAHETLRALMLDLVNAAGEGLAKTKR